MTLHEKLIALAAKLDAAGQKEDAATVFSAAFATAPGPTPKLETFEQVAPGFYHHMRLY